MFHQELNLYLTAVLLLQVKIAQKATKQISLSASEITLNNIQTGFNAQVMQGITFTVTGNDNVLSLSVHQM